jgi:hypothetical protein
MALTIYQSAPKHAIMLLGSGRKATYHINASHIKRQLMLLIRPMKLGLGYEV